MNYRIEEFIIDGKPIKYAQWVHRFNNPNSIGQAQIDNLRTFLCPGDFVIDIGAFSGDTAVPMALCAGNVLAIEPNIYAHEPLDVNAELHPNIIVEKVAATKEDGEFEYDSTSEFLNGGILVPGLISGKSYKIRGRNLATLLLEKYDHLLDSLRYIKSDVEGHDFIVFKTLITIISIYRPHYRVEFFAGAMPMDERKFLVGWFLTNKYNVYKVIDEDNYYGKEITCIEDIEEGQYDVFCVPQ